MLLTIPVTASDVFFEFPSLDNYSHVAVVSRDPPKGTYSFILSNFTELGLVNGEGVGLLFATGLKEPVYVKVKPVYTSLHLRFTDKDLNLVNNIKEHVTLHFKVDK